MIGSSPVTQRILYRTPLHLFFFYSFYLYGKLCQFRISNAHRYDGKCQGESSYAVADQMVRSVLAGESDAGKKVLEEVG